MERATHDPSARRPHGPEDEWVDGPQGRFWGRFGAAGLLLASEGSVLLQLRVEWSHFGGTWGVLGGARKQGETAEQTAIREADEEGGVPPELVQVIASSVEDLGYWSYTTVLARATQRFEPVIGDVESAELRWVPYADVDALPLHPKFGARWPELRPLLQE